MLAIIDYGMGNLFSVEKALRASGVEPIITSDAKVIQAADKIVLPGVGAFGDCMKNLEQSGLIPEIKQFIASGKPFLGICLGLQLLFDSSEESPGVAGLGIFAGTVKKISAQGYKIPHMGWNSLVYHKDNFLFRGLNQSPYVYFVHSFQAVPDDASLISAYTDYGGKITAAVTKDNVQAVQFHPEKSSQVGMQILRNFVQSGQGRQSV